MLNCNFWRSTWLVLTAIGVSSLVAGCALNQTREDRALRAAISQQDTSVFEHPYPAVLVGLNIDSPMDSIFVPGFNAIEAFESYSLIFSPSNDQRKHLQSSYSAPDLFAFVHRDTYAIDPTWYSYPQLETLFVRQAEMAAGARKNSESLVDMTQELEDLHTTLQRSIQLNLLNTSVQGELMTEIEQMANDVRGLGEEIRFVSESSLEEIGSVNTLIQEFRDTLAQLHTKIQQL